MRDPEGRLRFVDGKAVRTLNPGFTLPEFLRSAAARELVADGKLVPFEIVAGDAVESPQLAFVTLPTEWSDAHVQAAAGLTLDIAERVLGHGFELKDASAWNIIFDGGAAVFCDHFSFRPIASQQWWAFGQFCRHFIFPLACARQRGLAAREAFLLERDGLTEQRARRILGWRMLLPRTLPLMVAGRSRSAPPRAPAAETTKPGSPLHGALIRYARYATQAPARRRGGSFWSGYVNERSHYSAPEAEAKRGIVARWLAAERPRAVLDIGCNTGEFSLAALAAGAKVIAIDSDHDSVQQLFLAQKGNRDLCTLIANFADMHGSRGWAEGEFPGLLGRLRGRCDMLLMLAVVHHIHISESIPLEEIAALCAELTTAGLIVELIEPGDPMARQLAANRDKEVAAASIDNQLAAFARHFDTIACVDVVAGRRKLALLKKRG
ncbi:MAG TPA: methyltransferase domain-containing protein [Rhizomicrobium sp.]|jgi:SAM-dependent methyltransferase|nr:methyltransferase domain-containing protein [Rhizomicrobium sp.]